MAVDSIALGIDGICFRPAPEPLGGARAISASVGLGGVNKADDVRVIQSALNDVPVNDGGPATPLVVDGISGPLTAKAIADFQLRKLGFADGRVDPNGPTLRALNAAGSGTVAAAGGGSVVAASAVGAGPRPTKPLPRLDPDPFIVPLIERPRVRRAVRAAGFHLTLVQPFVNTPTKKQLPQGVFFKNVRASMDILDGVFSFFKFANRGAVHARLRTTFRNMEVALNRHFDIPPLITKNPNLFAPNTIDRMESTADAYTTAGGAFDGPDALNSLGVRNNLIFLCANLATEKDLRQVLVLIHELAHYVSPRSDPIIDEVKGRFEDKRAEMDALAPDRKIRNAEHYALYAGECLTPAANPFGLPP